MKIRPSSNNDVPAIVELIQELGYPADYQQMEKRLTAIKEREGVVLVAVNEHEKVVGCIHVFIDLRLAEGETGEIVSLVVKNDARGQGVGTALLTKAIEWIQKKGGDRVRVRANAIRKQAHEFYKKNGFEEIKSQKIFLRKIHLPSEGKNHLKNRN